MRVSGMLVAASPLHSEVRRETGNWLRLIIMMGGGSISQQRTWIDKSEPRIKEGLAMEYVVTWTGACRRFWLGRIPSLECRIMREPSSDESIFSVRVFRA